MSSVPAWIQIFQALLTPAIAIAVGAVGFLQWRTAHQKVVLDVFDRRMKIFEEVHEAISYVLQEHGNLVGHNAGRKLLHAWQGSRFLFGNDVPDMILAIRKDALKLGYYKGRLDRPRIPESERDTAAKEAEALETKVFESATTFSDLCVPYIRMDQKRVRTPMEWLKDRNRQRLSHADDKQH